MESYNLTLPNFDEIDARLPGVPLEQLERKVLGSVVSGVTDASVGGLVPGSGDWLVAPGGDLGHWAQFC